ncbi:MAG: hypothetical protein JWL71_4339 [Acidobacteria bacterium]|nr:hypothetical protein [Acidobacteriota bacterium]
MPVRPALGRAAIVALLALWTPIAGAQTISERGFFDGRGIWFPQTAPDDQTQAIGDVLFREEVFLKPAGWIQFAAGLDLRANSHDQVEDRWRLDLSDRGTLRPRAAVRRLTATITAPKFSLDVGKQFIRWGRADILNPTDRFAPRDFMNVIDPDFLPVLGVRPAIHLGNETFEVVWVPRLTPSRLPLFDQRWTVLPGIGDLGVQDGGSLIPKRSQQGARWNHTGERFEMSLSYFDGFNHLPDVVVNPVPLANAVELTRVYPDLRSYGGDLAIPSRWLLLKGEAAYFTSPSGTHDEYVLYVVEVERQAGEWLLDVGYAGDVSTKSTGSLAFAPDRGIARSVIGRVSYTVDPRRSIAIEGAAHQDGKGFYVKGEFSDALAQHWRLTLTGVGLAGDPDDFLGQFSRNSYVAAGLRLNF